MSETSSHPLTPLGGEFRAPGREAAFQAERLPDTLRHVRVLFLLSSVLNALFLLSDWRFYGDPHFYVAIPARVGVVAVSILCVWLVRWATTFQHAQRLMLLWELATAIGVAFLVSSHSNLALFVVLLLPSIYYLVVPTSFRWTVTAGVTCSILLLGGYLLPEKANPTETGLILAMVTLNLALILVVTRSNRLQRTEWAATQAAREAKDALVESRAMFETMFKTVPIPLIVSRADGTLVTTNDAAIRYFGIEPETLGIRSAAEVYENPDDRAIFLDKLAQDGRVTGFETTIRLADGTLRAVLVAGDMVEIRGEHFVMSAVVDITERKAAEERVWRAASHDSLTGLPNRGLFQSRLEQALAEAERNGTHVSILLVDLDNLKTVNDTMGHDAGDALLKETANRLKVMMRECDTVARLGGDEFVIVVIEPILLANAMSLAEQVLSELRFPFRHGDEVLSGLASIGVAGFPEHDRKPTELLKDADLALYAAKAQGRNRAVAYTPDMRHRIEQRATVSREIQEAVRLGEIIPYYQPKVDLVSGKVTGFEALARWQHPEQGFLTPASFLTAFEDPELSITVGEHMIRQVAGDIRRWLDRGIDCGRVAVNLSTAQFNWIGLAKRFIDILQEAGVPNERLEVEITETVFLGRSSTHVVTALKQFHDSGIRIALDDFGTGYASLIHLKQFPVDDIKIDQSFVTDLETDSENAAIVQAVIELGLSLGMNVIAEGVETEEQAEFLRSRGCAQAQGNLYAEPMPMEEVQHFLDRQRARCA
ncbi:putative bifunctional diguanylate cyclase/phosphodiesterase [Microvirga antarctica]|uniref:putative bifunctional diguanylate cyclase/phosphodiesterase n=1 Tax=Microvirga antarctica TaxID=2819233 RepID=UPI001B3139B3|nr:EAL domain-containing protein [Microvirga antarctica]